MNSLLIYENEVISPGKAIISGPRAVKLIQEHSIENSADVRIAVYNNGLGNGKIVSNGEKLEINYQLTLEPPIRENVLLAAAISRPQTVKKIIQLSSYSGIQQLILFKAEKTEKSYLTSKVLKDESVQNEIELALQQSFDCYAPEILIEKNYVNFQKTLETQLNENTSSKKLILDVPRIGSKYSDQPLVVQNKNQKILIALGPEAGWSDTERTYFSQLGFENYNLGSRIFRSETALAQLFGQVQLARRLAS